MFSIFCLLFVVGVNSQSAELDWWRTSVIYQIFPRSFKDSNGDGIGDLNGIIEKLDYIKDLGVDAIWIQPVYRSPMVDMGYDPSTMREIDPIFGTLDDMKNLIQASHERNLKVVMDIVANHMSDQSDWFKRSVNREDPFTDYFIWHDGKRVNNTHVVEPNNWVSMFSQRESAWRWNENRQQYYFYQFCEQQPDINYHNPKVQQEMEDLLKFWLDLGADGFRIDAIPVLFEAAHLLDEPVNNQSGIIDNYSKRFHIYTAHQQGNLHVLHRWRKLLDEYGMRDGKTRLLAVEDVTKAENLFQYFGNETFPLVHIPFYFRLVYLNYMQMENLTKLDKVIHDFVDHLPKNSLPNWLTDSHDIPRVSSRFGVDAVDAFNMLSLLLPGSACVYYGSEIGLEDSLVRVDQKMDAAATYTTNLNRDPSRGPMPWDDTKNGGFTKNDKPWLPLSARYWHSNVERQLKEPNSHLKIFKRLMALRRKPVLKNGDLKTYIVNNWTYLFTRSANNETIAVVINLGSESRKICSGDSNFGLPQTMYVHTGSLNSGFKIGDKITVVSSKDHDCTELRPKAGLVLTTYATAAAVARGIEFWLLILALGMNILFREGIC